MSDLIETIELDPNHRVLIYADEDAECPRGNWDMHTGFVKIEGRGDSRRSDVPAVHEPIIPIAEAHERLDDGRYTQHGRLYGNSSTATEERLTRWARIFHGLVVEYDSEHGGYWFVHQDENLDLTGLPAEQAELIRQEREMYEEWAEGNVYGVVLEKRERYVRVIDSGSDFIQDEVDWDSTMDSWEELDAVWGNYLNRGETLEQLGRGIAPDLGYTPPTDQKD